MRVQFVNQPNGPERLLAEAEIVFDDANLPYYDELVSNPLAGMKLVGFSIWQGADGEVYVTFPARAFGAGSERRFFDLVRTVEPGNAAAVKALKGWIVGEYRSWAAEHGGKYDGQAERLAKQGGKR